ncbi:restriction endonuclease subunit S [Methanolobus sp. WCC5]|uniref:restriction endonuclease subunit S n=1 Tax=Methanolobus sp. WCC5 TaxID=3125785 RepID=UPI0032526359
MNNGLVKRSIGELSLVFKSGLSSYYLKNQGESEKEVPLINFKDIYDGVIDASSVERVKVHETEALEKSRVSKGDLVLSTIGTFKAAVADESADGFVISANITAITFSDSVIPAVVAAYLNSPAGQKELKKWASGGTTVGLNKTQLSNVLVPVPSLELQQDLQKFIALAQEYSTLLSKEAEIWNHIIDAVIVKTMDS